ncbi:DUF881 domain-containing protein [Salsuginibacillus kocurii]|uniref:DUF881 domain-containing protein n=1 Tax=Salsuginibacillus kocurii TaxID=427078 RepID=UPI0003698086|nr:DUF881 domain-containing protein [Salsuginibacillus kocurii]
MKARYLLFAIAVCTGVVGGWLLIQPVGDNAFEGETVLELRQLLDREQERALALNESLSEYESLLADYQHEQKAHTAAAMEETLEDLEKNAGLTDREGGGLLIRIKPEEHPYETDQHVRVEHLRRLLNDLNRYEAEDVAIGHERITTQSAFREVNQIPHINGNPLPALPLTVYVLTDEPAELKSQMQVAESVQWLENDRANVNMTPAEAVSLPAFSQELRMQHFSANEEGEK